MVSQILRYFADVSNKGSKIFIPSHNICTKIKKNGKKTAMLLKDEVYLFLIFVYYAYVFFILYPLGINSPSCFLAYKQKYC